MSAMIAEAGGLLADKEKGEWHEGHPPSFSLMRLSPQAQEGAPLGTLPSRDAQTAGASDGDETE